MIDVYYVLRSIVYAQSFFWLYLLNKNYRIDDNIFKKGVLFLLVLTYFVLIYTGFSFSQYSNDLLMFYNVLLICSYVFLTNKYNYFDALCLSFLIVFINSYYWEFMLHLNVLIFYGLNLNQFIQAIHLVPAYLLYKKLEFDDIKKVQKLLLIGLMISTLNLMSIFIVPINIFGIKRSIIRVIVNKITRVLCLSILLLILNNHVENIKKEMER